MIVKINGKEIFRFENSVPGIYKNVTVSHSYEGIDYDYVNDDGKIYILDIELFHPGEVFESQIFVHRLESCLNEKDDDAP